MSGGRTRRAQVVERPGVMDRPGFALARVGLAVNDQIVAAMTATGLKPRQCLALMHLAAAGAMGQVALAKALDVDPSVLVSILNDLESKDLAIRRREPSDRRRHVVQLTERGHEVHAELERAVAGVELDLFADLDHADRAVLSELLSRLGAACDAACAED